MGTKRRVQLDDLERRLDPKRTRADVAGELDDLFLRGSVPDPLPEGFLPGRLLLTTWWDPADVVVRRIARLYMPWMGKSFDPSSSRGVNVLRTHARRPMRLLWPSYAPEREYADRIEAFPFETRIDAGAVDDVKVLKIDYDHEPNPQFVIRRILDELVQVDEGLYLGKILFRRGSGMVPIGFFSLQSEP